MDKKSSLQIIFFILLVFVDQLSKYVIRQTGGFYICNKNLAFGLNFNYIFFLIFLGLVISAFLISKNKIRNYTPLILIVAGGLSNIFDRIKSGCVIDFIDLKFWPVFNLADVFIVAGVIIILTSAFKKKAA